MEKKVKILILEDFKPDVELIKRELYKAGIQFEYIQVDNRKDYLAGIKNFEPEIIISDFSLPQYDGISAIIDLRDTSPETPLIIVTGSLDEETAADTIKSGAWDYVVKERLYRLPSAVNQCLKLKEEIREKKVAEKILRETEDAYETLRSNVPLALYRSTPEGNLIYTNPAYVSMFGFESVDEALETPANGLYKDKKDRDDMMLMLVNEETIINHQVQLKRKDGGIFWAAFNIKAIFDKDGNHIFQDGIITDITELNQTHEELIRAKDAAEEADRLKTAFLANMSHEIRTPMNAIIGFSDLLIDPGVKHNEMLEFVQHIHQNSEALLKIIGDIIDIAKIEAGIIQVDLKNIDLNEILKDCFKTQINDTRLIRNGVTLNYNPGKQDVLTVRADPIRIKQIINNLITNALKFTETGSVDMGFNIKNDEVEVYVEDTGLGIPDEMKDVIFERFRQVDDSHTREYGGTGLGLTIAKNLVEKMGGRMWVESKLYEGSTFRFTLPLEKPDSIPEQIKESILQDNKINMLNFQDKNILIAEDVDSNFLYLETVLKPTGAMIYRASDGKECVEFCRNNPDIDLILMDIQMPVMNGYDATRKIRSFRPDLTIIGQTAYALTADKRKVLDSGCNDYLVKPIGKQKLLETLLKYIK